MKKRLIYTAVVTLFLLDGCSGYKEIADNFHKNSQRLKRVMNDEEFAFRDENRSIIFLIHWLKESPVGKKERFIFTDYQGVLSGDMLKKSLKIHSETPCLVRYIAFDKLPKNIKTTTPAWSKNYEIISKPLDRETFTVSFEWKNRVESVQFSHSPRYLIDSQYSKFKL